MTLKSLSAGPKMAKAMPKELRREITRVLEKELNRRPGTEPMTRLSIDSLTNQAVEHLIDLGVLKDSSPDSDYLRVTAYGREYYGKLTAPRWYWFKQNWFAAIVALATIAASVGGIVVNALD